MATLRPDEQIELPGVVLRSVGVAAEADADVFTDDGGRAAQDLQSALVMSNLPPDAAAETVIALAVSQATVTMAVPLTELTTTAPGAGGRAPGEEPAVELTVAAPPPDEAQVILEVDGTGVLSWHLPLSDAEADAAGATRGIGDQVFRVPVVQAPLPGPVPGDGDRALRGLGLSKLLHVLRYPLERVAGGAAEFLVSRWEATHRPYGLRRYDDGGLAGPAGFRLSSQDLAALAGKPTLLLVHGTFSTADGAFDDLDTTLLPALRQRYGGRVLLFDHPSVATSPVENARWLLEHTGDTDLVLDVVAHSRGGLVGRALTAEPTFSGVTLRAPTVRRLVHVASPNNGTPLASPDRWTRLLDTVTNAALLFPGAGTKVLAAVIATVKQLGTGALHGLDGLASMDPGGPFLQELLPASGTAPALTFTVASDYEPNPGTVQQRAWDLVADGFFAGFLGGANDLVVPTQGVARGQAVTESYSVPGDLAVSHTNYFAQQKVRDRLAAWLAA